MTYVSAEAWWYAAMQRESTVSPEEELARRNKAHAHNQLNGIHDPDALADQELYILGKMDLQEYEAYLLFKHSPTA